MFGRSFVATMLFGIGPHILLASLFTSLLDGATFMGGGAKLTTSFIKFQDHNTHHGAGIYQKETTFGMWMKEPASSPGLLDCAVCARVVNTNLLTVTNAGCRIRFYPTAVHLWFFHMLRMLNC